MVVRFRRTDFTRDLLKFNQLLVSTPYSLANIQKDGSCRIDRGLATASLDLVIVFRE